ncbi:hypothetical protein Y88_2521 [Novosphingobium nitrogenifigens DSM 19370]|uniref:Uncharacterized protein n=1 Tax=Novosphingobium nitrogenifigens DSM 19370 TaxID=983920 RepID=F1Z6S6_9SPHN|nr:hypothetical protein Y88_2521 [Novosphingobium nitrogenifigens DSM 19370]
MPCPNDHHIRHCSASLQGSTRAAAPDLGKTPDTSTDPGPLRAESANLIGTISRVAFPFPRHQVRKEGEKAAISQRARSVRA